MQFKPFNIDHTEPMKVPAEVLHFPFTDILPNHFYTIIERMDGEFYAGKSYRSLDWAMSDPMYDSYDRYRPSDFELESIFEGRAKTQPFKNLVDICACTRIVDFSKLVRNEVPDGQKYMMLPDPNYDCTILDLIMSAHDESHYSVDAYYEKTFMKKAPEIYVCCFEKCLEEVL